MRKLAILVLLVLAGCETGPTRQQVLASLVGRTEADTIRTLGAPNQVIEANGHRFLAYYDAGVGYAPVAPFGPFGYGFGYYPATVPIPRTCETTIEITAGRVATWTLRGNAC